MAKGGDYSIIPGGGIDSNGHPFATAAIVKDGKPYVTSVNTYHTMTMDEFNAFSTITGAWFGKQKLTNLSQKEVVKLEKEGSKMLTDLGDQAANS
jgi:hypothetical protein